MKLEAGLKTENVQKYVYLQALYCSSRNIYATEFLLGLQILNSGHSHVGLFFTGKGLASDIMSMDATPAKHSNDVTDWVKMATLMAKFLQLSNIDSFFFFFLTS